jgi:hypothetical protein
MIPKKEHSVYIKHKLINEKPFIELTLFNKENELDSGKAVDQSTFSPTENETLWKVIMGWMYE